ncbi:E3 SUMO-protein ligase ZNF451 isoform 1-T3 [Menidia menidia]
MSSPTQAEEDDVEEEVEFVSDSPLRPVLDCIDLLSDSEDEACSSLSATDKITRQKARVTSTLDRLAQQVAQDKKERAAKCRAFKEKQILQRVHGQQELAVTSTNGTSQEAKRCVDMWLKMPGLKPGVISAGFGRRHIPPSFPRNTSARHTCPVINCGRVYDHTSLLEGHLKRFDHSPCDPAINLRGSPPELFACVACGQHFQTKEAWRGHVESKVSSSSPEDHSLEQSYQRIACFACPACYLLFNLRDECLQHMSAKNHFTESLSMTESRGAALPVPVPQIAKNRLLALCKDVAFTVRCSLCHKALISHQAAQAHFNVHCRHGCAVAKADKTIVEVMTQLQVQGQCSPCSKFFLSRAEVERHKASLQHHVEVNQTMAKALLQFSRFTQRAAEAEDRRQSAAKKRSSCDGSPAKRQKLSQSVSASGSRGSASAWFCECGSRFSEESAAGKHLLAINQIFHQCGVCGKHMGESSIARLHMSRFHGGAHLSNFLFYCRKCKVEMPRKEDILLHVSEAHSGHTYFTEREVPHDAATLVEAKASTSREGPLRSSSASKSRPERADTPSSGAGRMWMCRMCEDIFDSERAVLKHCADVSSHSFQRFICGHCPQKFFKESTVRRHCVNEHDGQVRSFYFCGLCDSMQFESEDEFMEHYVSLHSKDYYCVDDTEVVEPAAAAAESLQPTCPCMSLEESKQKMKATYTQCMRSLAAEGKCQYVCAPCSLSVPSYAQMKTHVHTRHAALNLDKSFHVECGACQESFNGVPSFHKHYHTQHCTLEPCASSRISGKDPEAEPSAVKVLHAVEVKPHSADIEDEKLAKFLNISQVTNEKEEQRYESDDEMNHASSPSEDAARESAELEEALKRSLLEF